MPSETDHNREFYDISCSKTVKKYGFAIIALLVLLSVTYANSFYGTWVFDDKSNILENGILTSFTWSTFIQQYVTDHFCRPLIYLSFLLNYRIGGYDIFGYHILNFAIHFTSAIFVFLFIYKTLNLPKLSERYGEQAYSIALLAAALWATSPLHVTAVTYIVQRMASMAGMFYFMGMYFYVQGRTAQSRSSAAIFYCLCSIAAIMAFFSKENAAMLPVSLYLYDLLLIRGADRQNIVKDLKRFALPFIGFLLLGAVYLLTTSFPLDYSVYTFSLKERLLTEPRVIMFYIFLLLYPMPGRLMLDHDYTLSTSLFSPWTTALSIVVIIGLIVWALIMSRKRPLLAYCILFFFLNHVIEGSIIPIEIIYEYRNYIPSISFFMLLSLFMIWVLIFFRESKMVFFLVAGCITFLLAAQGDTVYRRNQYFSSEKYLWLDNSRKAPNLSRPHINLSIAYIKEGSFKKALVEAEKAVALNKNQAKIGTVVGLTNLAVFTSVFNNDQKTAIVLYQRALALLPNYTPARGAMAMLMVKNGTLNMAEEQILKVISTESRVSYDHSNYALILLHQNKMKEALKAAHHAWNLDFTNTNAKMIIAEIMSRRKQNDRSIMLWESCLRDIPGNQRILLALVELYDRTGQYEKAIVKLNFLIAMGNGSLKQLLSQKNSYDHIHWIDETAMKPIIRRLMAKMDEGCL